MYTDGYEPFDQSSVNCPQSECHVAIVVTVVIAVEVVPRGSDDGLMKSRTHTRGEVEGAAH